MRRTSWPLAIAGLSLLALPALADQAPADPVARCKALFPISTAADSQAAGGFRVAEVEAIGDTGCRYTNLRIAPDSHQAWTVGSLTIDRIDFKRAEAGELPLTASLRAEDIRFSPNVPDAAFQYQMRLVQKPIELALDYDFDTATKILTIRDFTLQGPAIGHLGLTVAMGGFDPDAVDFSSPPAEKALAALTLNGLTLDFENKGLIEGYALLPALYVLPNGSEDPEGAIAAAKGQAMAALATLAGAVPKDTITALGRFIQDLPQPKGRLQLALRPQQPIPLADATTIEAGDPAAVTALLKRLNLTASY